MRVRRVWRGSYQPREQWRRAFVMHKLAMAIMRFAAIRSPDYKAGKSGKNGWICAAAGRLATRVGQCQTSPVRGMRKGDSPGGGGGGGQ